MSAIVVFSVLMLGAYSWWILRRAVSWKLYPVTPSAQANEFKTSVSVVIAVRNESNRISGLLEDLLKQEYDSQQLEIIVSDDFSEDNTIKKVSAKLSSGNFRFQIIKASANDSQGKKHALWRAITAAKGDIILTTDADCRLSPHWVASMSNKFKNASINMVTGMVVLRPENGMIARLERMDQLVLSAIGVASVAVGSPLLCSGANLAFRKQAFIDVGGYQYGINDPSGDDTYLMFQMGDAVAFNKDACSLVVTEPIRDVKGIINQRIRWASKMRGYGKPRVTAIGILVSLVNIAPLIMLMLTSWIPLWFVAAWLIGKFLADLILLKPIASFYKQSDTLLIAPLYALIYPFYVLMAFVFVFKRGYTWKDRNYPG
ncbi:MAG: glycosyltransferase [Bacteroidota bacterium]